MTVYNVRAKRWKRGWELHIDGIGVTQVKRLTKAEVVARDYIALMTGESGNSVQIKLTAELGDELDKALASVREAQDQAEALAKEAAGQVRDLVYEMQHTEGLTGAETALALNISPQRVSQLTRNTKRRTGLLRPARRKSA